MKIVLNASNYGRFLCLLTMLLSGYTASAADPSGGDALSNWALVYQETLPALAARQEVATARTAAAQRYFQGELPLEQAFPSLTGAPLDTRS